MWWTRSTQEIYLVEINGEDLIPPTTNNLQLPKKLFIYISKFWESYRRLSSNKGYIQGELNLVDRHDQFDIEISMITLKPR